MPLGSETRFASWLAAVAFLALAGATMPAAPGRAAGDDPPRRLAVPKQGSSFQSRETREMQADAIQNPGLLWAEQGKALFERSEPGAKPCSGCHGAAESALPAVAAHYPAIDAETGDLLNLEGRINRCRTRHQGRPALAYESAELLGLTAFLASRAAGVPVKVAVDGPARPHFEAGRAFFETRQGQLNLSCRQCHDDNWGRRLRGDTISQGQPTGYPAYRFEWNGLGSLHRRLRLCSLGVKAEVYPQGSPEYLALELYLAWRAEGLAIEAPGVRK